jgi:N-acyl homoserine lactone hydrolase
LSLSVHALRLGETVVDHSFLVWQMNCGQATVCPVTGYLILGGETPILVDTGIRSIEDFNRNAKIPARQSKHETIEAQLAPHGLQPKDIGAVIYTHLHIDHCGFDDKLSNARLIVQRKELQFAAAPLFPVAFYDRTDISRLVGDLWPRVELLDGDRELFPGVRTVTTQGHTPAHMMIYVDVPSGTAVLAGDAVYIASLNVDRQIPPGYYYSLPDVMEDLRMIRRDAKHVLPTHDPRVYELYPNGVR